MLEQFIKFIEKPKATEIRVSQGDQAPLDNRLENKKSIDLTKEEQQRLNNLGELEKIIEDRSNQERLSAAPSNDDLDKQGKRSGKNNIKKLIEKGKSKVLEFAQVSKEKINNNLKSFSLKRSSLGHGDINVSQTTLVGDKLTEKIVNKDEEKVLFESHDSKYRKKFKLKDLFKRESIPSLDDVKVKAGEALSLSEGFENLSSVGKKEKKTDIKMALESAINMVEKAYIHEVFQPETSTNFKMVLKNRMLTGPDNIIHGYRQMENGLYFGLHDIFGKKRRLSESGGGKNEETEGGLDAEKKLSNKEILRELDRDLRQVRRDICLRGGETSLKDKIKFGTKEMSTGIYKGTGSILYGALETVTSVPDVIIASSHKAFSDGWRHIKKRGKNKNNSTGYSAKADKAIEN